MGEPGALSPAQGDSAGGCGQGQRHACGPRASCLVWSLWFRVTDPAGFRVQMVASLWLAGPMPSRTQSPVSPETFSPGGCCIWGPAGVSAKCCCLVRWHQVRPDPSASFLYQELGRFPWSPKKGGPWSAGDSWTSGQTDPGTQSDVCDLL